MRPRRASIAFTLSIALVGVTTLLLGLFGYLSYRANYLQEWEELRHEESNLADQLAVALALPSWNFDRDQIDRVLDGAMENQAVAGVVVRLADRNSTLHARARDEQWGVRASDGKFPDDLLMETRNITTGNETLGTLRLYVTPRFVSAQLARIRNVMLAVVLVVDAILILILYFLLWRMVLKPLQEVESFAAAVSSGRPEVTLGEKPFGGEIESVRTSLESMVALLEQRYVALEKSGEDLRASEARLRAVGDNLPEGMVYQVVREDDGSRRFLYMSAGVERINGLAAADVLRDASLFYDRIVPEDRPKVAAAQRDSEATMSIFDVVARVRRPDGETRWIRFSSAPRRLPDGRVLWDGIALDITEHRLAAAAREETYGRLALALKAGRLGTFRRNLRTGLGVWDEQMYVICGMPMSARVPTYDEFVAMIHPADRDEVNATVRAAASGRHELSYSFRFIRPDGGIRHIETHAVVEPSEDGQAQWLIGVFNDSTSVVEAQARLGESAERLQLALKASNLGVWRYNLQTGQTEWDERMFVIFGVDRTTPILSHEEFFSRVVPEDREAVQQAWDLMLAGGKSYHVRFRVTLGNGEIRNISAQAMVSFDSLGRPEWVVGVDDDNTDIVQAIAESERLREQLVQAQKMETLGTLAAGIAHDFNNLLTGINGFVEMAATSLPANHEAADMLVQARRGALNARDLVRRILTFSGRANDSKRVPVNLGEVLREAAPLLTAALPPQVSLELDPMVDLPLVLADAGQVQQILMNLCTNGAHAIGSKPGRIRISARLREFLSKDKIPAFPGCRPGHYVGLAISDTGCGMDAVTVARIFEPFFTTKKTGEGTGLGLSIVHRIMTAHDGGISVRSVVGEGTTFTLYFPTTGDERLPAKPSKAETARRGTGQRVLVVDDEPSVVAVVRLALRRGGYAPEVFTASEEAWAHFTAESGQFDLLIIDNQMPKLSGADFVRRAREISPALPVILMSGRFARSEALKAPFDGVVAMIKKPFEIAELLRQVTTALPETSVPPG